MPGNLTFSLRHFVLRGVNSTPDYPDMVSIVLNLLKQIAVIWVHSEVRLFYDSIFTIIIIIIIISDYSPCKNLGRLAREVSSCL
jgi:hypothetical protein